MKYHVKKFRKLKGLSTTQLAEKSGVGQRTIERLEGAIPCNSSLYTFCKLAKALEVSVYELFECE